MDMADPNQLREEGSRLFQQGRRQDALKSFEKAADAFAALGNDAGQAEMLNNIGVLHRLQRNYTGALKALGEAETLFARLAAVNEQGQVLGNMGDLHAAQRNRNEAARCYSKAAELFAKDGDGPREVRFCVL